MAFNRIKVTLWFTVKMSHAECLNNISDALLSDLGVTVHPSKMGVRFSDQSMQQRASVVRDKPLLLLDRAARMSALVHLRASGNFSDSKHTVPRVVQESGGYFTYADWDKLRQEDLKGGHQVCYLHPVYILHI